eukprot:CAMPEP_0201475544 /NCGR_PEP_ID=MMETSP0151_2-20130828/948_1 /ASSEMBLY_ACC=CAM_ASM_000257 /TAXON_ID=200890 /ORGANISM="Paramoeba atlantica, Strain 621/1 / CCAP 1560/9" /LENGTH=732 /DNA_ID=CAMNT_0047855665 /DNA_START=72 /DNA_END=2270 /DNA_ORIENTATION=+
MFKGKKDGKDSLDFIKNKNIADWDVVEVGLWLNSINLSQYRDVFFFNEVDGEMLADIDEDDLIAIPIERMGHRKKILRKVATLRGTKQASQSHDGSEDSGSQHGSSQAGHSAAPSSSSSSSGNLRVKCVFKDEIRTLLLSSNETFDSFSSKLAKEFGSGYSAKYRDEDGDMVTLRNNEDIQAVLTAARKGRVKLTVFSARRKKKGKSSSKSSSSKSKKSESDSGEDFGVLENFVDGVIVADRKGTIQFFNASAEDMFGFDREEVIGRNVRMLMNEDDAKNHSRYLRRYRREGNSRIIGKGRKVVAKSKEGKLFDVWLSLSETDVTFTAIVQEIQGGERGVGGSVQVKDLQPLFSAFDRYPDPVVVVNTDGVIQYSNPKSYEAFLHDAGSLLGVSASVICPAISSTTGEDLLSDYVGTLRGIRGGLLVNNSRDVICYTKKSTLIAKIVEFSHREIDGTPYYILQFKSQEKVSGGTVLQTQRDVISTLVIPALIIDEQGIVQEMNGAAREVFGYTISEILGHNVRMLIPPGETYDNHTSYVSNFAKTGQGRGPGGSSSVVGKGRNVTGQDRYGNKLECMLSVTLAAEKSGDKIFTGIIQVLSKQDRSVADSAVLKQQTDVIDQLLIPACVITSDAIVRAFNKPAQELFGFSDKELIGRDVNELIPSGEIHNIHGKLLKNYADGKKKASESVVVGKGRIVTARHKDGHNFGTLLSVTERRDGPIVIFTGTFTVTN